jgi:hypothetical protein
MVHLTRRDALVLFSMVVLHSLHCHCIQRGAPGSRLIPSAAKGEYKILHDKISAPLASQLERDDGSASPATCGCPGACTTLKGGIRSILKDGFGRRCPQAHRVQGAFVMSNQRCWWILRNEVQNATNLSLAFTSLPQDTIYG